MKPVIRRFAGLLFIFLFASCSGQEVQKFNRQPYAAGRFYPALPSEINQMLDAFFASSIPRKVEGQVMAVIVPHAGYVFSGQVAASGFNQLEKNKQYRRVFLIGTSHTTLLPGASVYSKGDFITPLGTVKVDMELCEKLIREHGEFQYLPQAHKNEHSLEVQLPFLRHLLGDKFMLVPILIGTQSNTVIRKIAEALKPYFTPENLFVISSDFSHYPPKDVASRIDRQTADALVKNSPGVFLRSIRDNEARNIPGLATCICGWSSALTLLYITENNPRIKYTEIQYMNSGDSQYGNVDECVGYWSIVATMNENNPASGSFGLTETDKEQLLRIARSTLEHYLEKYSMPVLDASGFSGALRAQCGAFVTLTKKGELRGCIGRFEAAEPLYKVVQQMAISAATQDYRFPPVDRKELDELDLEISVLSPLRRISSKEEIILGKHGIYIKSGNASGTFLPQVASQYNWTVDEFLGRCSRDKAGLGYEGWEKAELYTYEAEVFGEKEHER